MRRLWKRLIFRQVFLKSSSTKATTSFSHSKVVPTSLSTEMSKSSTCCKMCSGIHAIYNCAQFNQQSPQQRRSFTTEYSLCGNCLNSGHSVSQCTSKFNCRICKKRHHTLIHVPVETSPNSSTVMVQDLKPSTENFNTIVLPVAEVEIRDAHNAYHTVRALIDSCSMINFISERLCNQLGLRRTNSSVSIDGLNNMTSTCNRGIVQCSIKPLNLAEPILDFNAVVSQKISSTQPKVPIAISNYPHLRNLKLADSKNYAPGSIDLLLGAELVPQILTGGRIAGKSNEPAALDSI